MKSFIFYNLKEQQISILFLINRIHFYMFFSNHQYRRNLVIFECIIYMFQIHLDLNHVNFEIS